jgi:hypothetical protein
VVCRNTEISPPEENIICSHDNVRKTVEFLTSALSWDDVPSMLTFECFKLPTETNDLEFDWPCSQPISKEEFSAQLNYDLGTFFFYKEDYNSAREHFSECLSSFRAMKNNNGFVKFNFNVLEVYVRACSGPTDGSKRSLLEQLNLSIVNHYMVSIFSFVTLATHCVLSVTGHHHDFATRQRLPRNSSSAQDRLRTGHPRGPLQRDLHRRQRPPVQNPSPEHRQMCP